MPDADRSEPLETPRLPHLSPEQMSPEQLEVHRAIVEGPRSGLQAHTPLPGPFNAMVHGERVGNALQALGVAIRYESSLSDRCRELAILMVAAFHHSEYEWADHEPIARRVGLTSDETAALRRGEVPDLTDSGEVATAQVVHALLHDGDIGDEIYAFADRHLGARRLVEITTLVGYYSTLAMQLRVFRVSG